MLTMTIATRSVAALPRAVTRATFAGLRAVKTFARAIAHRREVMQLAELDERALKDIGLTRADVNGALSHSWLHDPSAALVARSRAEHGVAAARREEGVRRARLVTPAVAGPAKTGMACTA